MLPNMTPRKKSVLYLGSKSLKSSADTLMRYSIDGWDANNKVKLRISSDQAKLAERLTEESKRLIEELTDSTQIWQQEVDHQLHERFNEVTFLTEELNKQKKAAAREDEAITHYRNRILRAMKFNNQALGINQECLILREGRIGIDLCNDAVERQLHVEMKVMKGCENLMDKTLKEITEKLQTLHAAIHQLDKDLEHKEKALQIDRLNLDLKESTPTLERDQNVSTEMCLYTLAQWTEITAQNLEFNAKAINSASTLRAYIDLVLKQICEDLQNQTDRTNFAFQCRIRETKEIKHNLEYKHADCMAQMQNVEACISTLEKEIAGKERSLALCQTRLSNRARRLEVEMTCDVAQEALYQELNHLQCSLFQLRQKLLENQAIMRYLASVHLMQEEEINIKANTLKIDEVECFSLRKTLQYSTF